MFNLKALHNLRWFLLVTWLDGSWCCRVPVDCDVTLTPK